jgi:hypothetical protein
MSAAEEILDGLLEELSDTLDLARGEPGAEPHPLVEMLNDVVEEAYDRWTRAKLNGEVSR